KGKPRPWAQTVTCGDRLPRKVHRPTARRVEGAVTVAATLTAALWATTSPLSVPPLNWKAPRSTRNWLSAPVARTVPPFWVKTLLKISSLWRLTATVPSFVTLPTMTCDPWLASMWPVAVLVRAPPGILTSVPMLMLDSIRIVPALVKPAEGPINVVPKKVGLLWISKVAPAALVNAPFRVTVQWTTAVPWFASAVLTVLPLRLSVPALVSFPVPLSARLPSVRADPLDTVTAL